jgi:hypothetical protein
LSFAKTIEDLESLVEFFKILHLNEVVVVILSHLFINYNNLNFMEMIKAIYVHLFIGIFLTYLANMFFAMVGPVVLGGGLDNLTVMDVYFIAAMPSPGSSPGPTTLAAQKAAFF